MVKLEIKDQVAWVILARAEKQNALNVTMFEQLNSIIKTIKRNRAIRAVVITGDGDNFCSGLDVASVMAKPTNMVKLLFKWLPGNQNLVQKVVLGWQSIPVPVIAMIKGNCFGGGLQIALGADYRIVDSNAKLAIMEARWGLCPDMGANLVLAGLVNYDQALMLASLAEPISATQAQKAGLVTIMTDDIKQSTDTLIQQLLARSPDTLAAIKRVTQLSYKSNKRAILAKETWSQIRLLMKPNTKIAIHNAKNAQQKSFQKRSTW